MLALLATITLLETQDIAPPAPPAAPPATRLAQAPPAPAVPPTPPTAPLPPRPPRPPRAPLELPPVPGADDVLRGDWPAAPSGVRITLDDRITVDDAVEAITKKAGWSASLNTGRIGDRLLVLRLGDVPVEEALRAALGGTGLVATRRGRVVVVSPAYGPVAARSVLTGFDTPSGKKFSGDFDDEDGRDALLAIGKAAGLSIVLPQGTLGKVTAHLKDVPVEEALKAVLTQAGLQAVREGSIVTVTGGDGVFGGRFEFHGELGPAMEQAMRDAQRAQRDLAREQRDAGQDPDGKDISSTGGDVVVESGQEARDVLAVKGSVTLRPGASARDVVAVLGSVTLEPGASARQAVAVGGDIRVGPGASLERDAVSVGGRVQVDPSGDVGGQRQAIDLPHLPQLLSFLQEHFGHGRHGHLFHGGETSPFWRVAAILGQYLLYLALGLLLVAVFPRRVEAVGAAMVGSPGRSLLVGLFGWVGQPVLSILLIATVVGILLLPVQALLVAVAVVLGFTSLSYLVGRAIPGLAERGSWVLQLAIGTAIVLLVTEIPVLGVMALVTAALVTFGAVLRTRFGQLAPEPPLPTSAVPPPPPLPPQVPPVDPQADAPPPPVG